MIESTISFIKKFDKRKKMEEDFDWVLKIVSSSQNFNHIVISNQLFTNFLHKWRNFMTEKQIKEYTFMFEHGKSMSIGQFL
jgi:hypothetical protein